MTVAAEAWAVVLLARHFPGVRVVRTSGAVKREVERLARNAEKGGGASGATPRV